MSVDLVVFLPVLALVAVAAYVQTVVGFAFALIVMGVLSGFNVLPITAAAVFVSLLAAANAFSALIGSQRHIHWRAVLVCLISALPAIASGYYLMNFLSENAVSTLRLILGLTILTCGLIVLAPPHNGKKESPLWTYGFFGAVGGVLGGLFSISGPPIIFQFYRQPLSPAVIRGSLLFIFLSIAIGRSILAAANGQVTGFVLILALIALPVVILFTMLGRRFPPRFSEKNLRRGVFGLLALSAIRLFLT